MVIMSILWFDIMVEGEDEGEEAGEEDLFEENDGDLTSSFKFLFLCFSSTRISSSPTPSDTGSMSGLLRVLLISLSWCPLPPCPEEEDWNPCIPGILGMLEAAAQAAAIPGGRATPEEFM